MIKLNKLESLKSEDKEVSQAIDDEQKRLNNSIELIASENVVSTAVLEAVGSILTNKYAEGYPGKRYYGGCVNVDVVETLAKERLEELFDCKKYGFKVNVQPHSGSNANMAVYFSVLKPGDKVLGMDLSSGGHLTHGSRVNFSGKLFDFISYGLTDEGYIDYDSAEALAINEKPKMIVVGASAYPRIIDFKRFKEIADKVGAYLMVDIAHIAGLVATNLHPSPLPYADFVTSTTHKTLRGPRGGIIMMKEEFERKVNSAIFPGIQGGPLEHVIAGKAVAFKEALSDDFKIYQKQILDNAKAMESVFLEEGINMVSSGTDNHLMLLDLRNLDLTGKDAEALLEEAGITTNKNGVPNDPQSPMITSGIRIGTPAITTRGFQEDDSKILAKIISSILKNKAIPEDIIEEVKGLCKKFPLFE